MNKPVIYALDFDGVLCDSAVETAITGWKAALQLWLDMSPAFPEQRLIDEFRRVRPIIETGFEAILVMRLLYEGESSDYIFEHFAEIRPALIEKSGQSIDGLKQLFGEIRDAWIHDNLPEWLTYNPLFPGITEKLRNLENQGHWFIVTTKQERFVSHILTANHIFIPGDRIFGLDRNKSKEDILIDLVNYFPDASMHFIEDRLIALLNVQKNPQLKNVKLLLATWGYNTEQDRDDAGRRGIELLPIENFII